VCVVVGSVRPRKTIYRLCVPGRRKATLKSPDEASNTPAEQGVAAQGQPRTARGLSRRDFLRLSAAGVSAATLAAILAACVGPSTATVATVVPSAAPSSMPASATPAASGTPTALAPSTPVAPAPVAPSSPPSATPAAASAAPSAAGSMATRTTVAGTATARAGVSGLPSGGKYSTLEPIGKRGGTFVEVVTSDARTNNPLLSADTPSKERIAIQFSPLLGLNPDTSLPFPLLATEVPSRANGGVSQDGLTYTFTLRQGVKWHDGTPATSADVVFTYGLLARKELGSPRTAEIIERVESVTAPDASTVVFKLKKVVAPFLVGNVAGTNYGIVPAHILGTVAVDQIKQHPFSTGDAQASIGTGPYKFKEWVKDDHATFSKNPDYFLGEPAIDEYIYKVVKDQDVVVASLKTGAGDFGAITPELVENVAKATGVGVTKYDTNNFIFYAHQLDVGRTTLFQEKAVRQALAFGLDRDAMVRAIYSGYATVGQGTMPTLSFAYAPDQLAAKYPYDTRKAEALLEEAGWKKGTDGIRAKDGKKLQFTLWTNGANKATAQFVTLMQQQWKVIGVDATPKTEEWNAFLSRIIETHDFEMFLVGFSWNPDPDQTAMWGSASYTGGFNLGKYANARVDEILAQGLGELDPAKRKAIYIQLQNILMDEVPNVILAFPQGVAVVNKRVKNFFPNAVDFRWNIHTAWLTDGR